MKCPLCKGKITVASTVENADNYTKRNCKCKVCGTSFYTIEQFSEFTQMKTNAMRKIQYKTTKELETLKNNGYEEIGVIEPEVKNETGEEYIDGGTFEGSRRF